MTIIRADNPDPNWMRGDRRIRMTLTDFLLDRIAEDEVAVRALKERVAADPGSFISLGLDHPELATGDSPSYLGEYDPARLLAECAAKRRIVEGIVPARDPHFGHPEYDAEWVLKEMAAVYAGYPDYDESWRP